ncbi:MAG: hypothetical protein ACRBF0_20515 [Calditrichia bacterium]
MDQQIQEIPTSFFPVMNEALTLIDGKAFTETEILSLTDSLFQMSRKLYFKRLSDADMLDVTQWFQIPLGKKIVSIETAPDDSYTKEDSMRVQNMPGESRAVIDTLLKPLGMEEMFEQMANSLTPIMMEAIVRKNLMTQNKGTEEIEAFLASDVYSNMHDTAVAKALEGTKSNLFGLYLQYSALEPSELETYTKFHQTGPGSKFIRATRDLLGGFFTFAAKETRIRFRTAVEKQVEGARKIEQSINP